jgi:hypothetical protein
MDDGRSMRAVRAASATPSYRETSKLGGTICSNVCGTGVLALGQCEIWLP